MFWCQMAKETSTQLVVFGEILYLDIRLLQIGTNCFIVKEKHIYEVFNLLIYIFFFAELISLFYKLNINISFLNANQNTTHTYINHKSMVFKHTLQQIF